MLLRGHAPEALGRVDGARGIQVALRPQFHLPVAGRARERQAGTREAPPQALAPRRAAGTEADPVMLEVFNNLFMSIAEQMGVTLENTAYSVNIKERLDFSCAVFDGGGNLIAKSESKYDDRGRLYRTIRYAVDPSTGTVGNSLTDNSWFDASGHTIKQLSGGQK